MINGALLDYLRKDEGKSLQFKDLADMAGQVWFSFCLTYTNLQVFKAYLISSYNTLFVAGWLAQ